MTTPQTDFAARMTEWQAEREVALKTARKDLRAQLRDLSVIEVTAQYEGYGDSGNVEDLSVMPAELKLPEELRTKLDDFVWSVAYNQHPGFENNEGGYGTLTWDVVADGITLDHANRYVECTHSYDEGL